MGSKTSAFLHSDWTLLAILVALAASWAWRGAAWRGKAMLAREE